jgi:hypothetical protein
MLTMNLEKLYASQEIFFMHYPEGFIDPQMLEHSKKHKVEKMMQMIKDHFTPEHFDNPDELTEAFGKLIARSSLVSVFEKVKFRDLLKIADDDFKQALTSSLKEMLHGDQKNGFESLISLLSEYKLAKWPILTVILLYAHPDYEVFIKPTTVKNILSFYEVEDITYSSKPSYAFYSTYREMINEIKTHLDPSLQNDNAFLSGFFMIAMELLAMQ